MSPSLADRLRDVISSAPSVSARPVSPVPRVEIPSTGGSSELPGRGGSLDPPSVARTRRRIDGRAAADVLGGEWRERAEGPFILVERFYPADARHGRMTIGAIVERLLSGADALGVLGRAWPSASGFAGALYRGGSSERPALAFLDLETTGLAGGAGTQAFLVGCAAIHADGVRVQQFLMPGLEHERALLAEVADWAADHRGLVTFNGRTFDVPLIETRFLFHRLAFPLGDLPHLDMLHPARRLWKARLSIAAPPLDDECCRLSVLERHLAGVHRVGDVAGFEIPSRYFQFVRDGDGRPLEAVLEHNRLDLLSLAMVTAHALTLIDRGPAAAAHVHECLGLGRVYERAGRLDDAEACFGQAAAWSARVGHDPFARADALHRLALCRRRAGRPAEAAQAWRELAELPGGPAALRREAREALAIHCEHRTRDLETARRLVLDLLVEGQVERRRAEALHRLERLERKLGRARGALLAVLDATL